MSTVIWFRVNKISIETWEACLQRPVRSRLVWPARPRRPPLSPPHCHSDNQHHRQLKVIIKCVIRSASALRGRTKICSNTRPHSPWPNPPPPAPGPCLKGEPPFKSKSGIILINIYAGQWRTVSQTLTFSCANSINGSDQWPVPDTGWVIGQFSFPLSSFKFSLHFITNVIRENASRVHILNIYAK